MLREEMKLVNVAEAVAEILQESVEAESGAASEEAAEMLRSEGTKLVTMATEFLHEQLKFPGSDSQTPILDTDPETLPPIEPPLSASDPESLAPVHGPNYVSSALERPLRKNRIVLERRANRPQKNFRITSAVVLPRQNALKLVRTPRTDAP